MTLSGIFRRSVPALFTILTALPAARAGEKSIDFSRFVVVGDSLTAGFQNFSLYDRPFRDGQEFGYAAQLAHQAGAALTLPLISYPGIPPALTIDPVTGTIRRETGIGSRLNGDIQATNLSVPGFNVVDALSHAVPGSPQTNPIDALADLILAEPAKLPGCGPIPTGPSTAVVSQLACAIALRPTGILLSIGSNDALQALTFGLPPTPSRDFAEQYMTLLAGLAVTGANVVVSNVPDVTSIPFASACGVDAKGTHYVPDIVGGKLCDQPRAVTPEQLRAIRSAVAAYNKSIRTAATRFGATVVDLDALFNRLAASGYRLSNGQVLTIAPGGGLFSLDLIHPSNTGYAILTNEVIQTINPGRGGPIPMVDVEQVAATDWLVPKLTK